MAPGGGAGRGGVSLTGACRVPLRPPVPPQRHDCPQLCGRGKLRDRPHATRSRRITRTPELLGGARRRRTARCGMGSAEPGAECAAACFCTRRRGAAAER
ncbi:hypothetical protein Sipo8835_29725 [Streptomyces ipomoeae]|uniref:Uncharacterized protein n=1 Tax=Streptomyces ipomoeae TaxID=103232 RepID=A0AAE9AYQ3_9ACTN|nr:hypothetical protein Sipo8835_29725 [Streptomyces ipomoeae]